MLIPYSECVKHYGNHHKVARMVESGDLFKIGPVSTRFKDVYDMYYLRTRVKKVVMRKLLKTHIFDDAKLRETDTTGILSRLNRIFKDKGFLKGLKDPTFAWLDVPAEDATTAILDFIDSL